MLVQSAAPVAHRSLLELDPELGARLAPERFARARALVRVRLVELLDGSAVQSVDPAGAGLLLVRGVLAREIVSAGATVATELLGPGDLLRPRVEHGADLLSLDVRWEPLSVVIAAELNARVMVHLTRWPEIGTVLLERGAERAHRLAVAQAISQLTGVDRRLHALLWHLAGRFGKVTADGVAVPLALSHRRLGELIGARRPTVSTALARLGREGCVARHLDGGWLLTGEPPQRLEAEALASRA